MCLDGSMKSKVLLNLNKLASFILYLHYDSESLMMFVSLNNMYLWTKILCFGSHFVKF